MMTSNRIVCVAAVACLLAGTALAQMTPTPNAPGQGIQAQPGSSGDADPQAIVDALFAAGGNHAGVRASGAKGTCVKGPFTYPRCRRPDEGAALRQARASHGALLHGRCQPEYLGQDQAHDTRLRHAFH
jgi:hypothetical protein